MSESLSRRLTTAAVALMVLVLLITAGVTAQAQSQTSDDPSDDPTEESSDDPTEESSDDPSEESDDEPSDALASGLQALLTSDDADTGALYAAFVQFLVTEYDTTLVVEDDVLSIQIDLQDLQD